MSDFTDRNLNQVQFYHGTGDKHAPGDIINPSKPHNTTSRFSSPDSAYFTTRPEIAHGWAVQGGATDPGAAHVYKVQPMGEYSIDPNFPEGQRPSGAPVENAAWNHQTKHPLRVLGEV